MSAASHARAHFVLRVPADSAMNAGEEFVLNHFAGDFCKNSTKDSLRSQGRKNQDKPKAIYHSIIKTNPDGLHIESLTVMLSDIYWPSNGIYPPGFPEARWISESFYSFESCIHSPAMLIKKIRFEPLVYRRDNWLVGDAMTFLRERYVGVKCLPLPWEFPAHPALPCTPLTCVYNAPAVPAPAPAPPDVDELSPSTDEDEEEEKEEGEISDDQLPDGPPASPIRRSSSATTIPYRDEEPPPPYQPLEGEYEQPPINRVRVVVRGGVVVHSGMYAGTRQQRRYSVALRPHPYN